MRLFLAVVQICVVLLAGLGGFRLWQRPMPLNPEPIRPVWSMVDGVQAVTVPGHRLVAEVGTHDDEFFAYLMFTYLRVAPEFRQAEVLLTSKADDGSLVYPVRIHVGNDLLTGIPILAKAQAKGLIGTYEWRYVAEESLLAYRNQTSIFVTAYNLPNRRKLETFSSAELADYTRRFVRFKSLTDPRIRRNAEPVPAPLTDADAHRLAADIVAVSRFFAIPVDFFLGIGAMENNYMDVKGDLGNAAWKKRPEKGDVVLKRRRGGVLVLNESTGVWQITRETLRYAHKLYLKDTRDYSALPQHLRPTEDLNPDAVEPGPLTTYAGIYFRYLLDRFHGDLTQAVGAYNGGPGNPNLRYESGVRLVADYARRSMEHAAALQGRPAAGTRFIGPSSKP